MRVAAIDLKYSTCGERRSRLRAWKGVGRVDFRRAIALASAEAHIAASLPHIAADYAGEHWLATYATLALTA